ncbi:HMG-box [Mycena galericulata]|nr:HMG-box [Mycena galericulata]
MRTAAEVIRHCAKLTEDWAEALKHPGASSNGKRKAVAADDDDEPAANGKRKRVTKKKDPNAPKRPASSYLLFQNEIRKEIKEKYPTLSNTELLNVIKTQWAEMPEARKAVYNDKMSKEKERYNAEKSAYDARSPEEVARADAEVAAAVAVCCVRADLACH